MAFSIGIVCYSIGVAVDMLLPAGVPLCAAPSEWQRRCLRAYVLEGRPACLRARVLESIRATSDIGRSDTEAQVRMGHGEWRPPLV